MNHGNSTVDYSYENKRVWHRLKCEDETEEWYDGSVFSS